MTTDVEAASDTAQKRRDYSFLFALSLLGILLVLWVMLSFATRTFMTPLNITNLLRQGSMIAILALGETFVIITAGIDLSVGAIAGFGTVVVAMLLEAGVPIWLSRLVDAALRPRDRHVSRFRRHQNAGAAVHHDAGDADFAARHRAADDDRARRSTSPTRPSPTSRRRIFWAFRACSGW